MNTFKLIAVCLVLLVVGPRVFAAGFHVENKCPPKFTVVNKVPAAKCCGGCDPNGKTCREIGCPANGGGRCSCSDTLPQPGWKWQRIGSGPWELVPDDQPAPTPTFALPAAFAPTSGCAGGNCPVPTQTQRGGIFRR